MPADSTLEIVLVYPELLGTYGDRGNAVALAHRARGHGLDYRLTEVTATDPLPRSADIYLVGGGEDGAMLLAWDLLRSDGGLLQALEGGAVCFGVCAGFQLLSREFRGPDEAVHEGLGLLDVRCGRLRGRRAVGEVIAEPEPGGPVGFLTGFENHQGDAVLGPQARPLGRLVRGVGNGDGRTEGACQGQVVGTYLHGPALVRNDGLADHLLERVAGALVPFDDELVRQLRQERRTAALSARTSAWNRLKRRPGTSRP